MNFPLVQHINQIYAESPQEPFLQVVGQLVLLIHGVQHGVVIVEREMQLSQIIFLLLEIDLAGKANLLLEARVPVWRTALYWLGVKLMALLFPLEVYR